MDRIAALRNVEEALADLEAGEADLAAVERRVRAAVRTYATEFEGDLSAYRATVEDATDEMVVLARTEQDARERVAELTGGDPPDVVECLPTDGTD